MWYEIRHKRLHTTWFHLYEILEMTESSSVFAKGRCWGMRIPENHYDGFFGVLEYLIL